MILAATPTVVQDIMDDREEREMWIVGREMERPPYFHAGKGGDLRLAKALRVVQEGRITPHSDGSYTVEGSEHRQYRVTDTCSCPQSQQGTSKWCYHHVAVALYIEWRKRCATLTAAPLYHPVPSSAPDDDADAEGGGSPIDDETLPLPLPPSSVEERLAQHAPETPRMPQEVPMTEDPSPYIPEPADAPVAVLDAPRTTTALTPVDDLEAALQTWTTQRAIVQRFLKQELKPNIDYYTLKIGGKESKASLSKAGAEKVMGWLKLQASFTPDTGTWEMLGRPTDQVFYICTLRTRSGDIVGEGRGARSIKKDGGDVNKAIKMAEKSANVSAVLRTGALSDIFTQDLEDSQEPEPVPPRTPTTPRRTAQEMRQRLWTIVQQRAPEATTREAIDDWILTHTGLALHPDAYADILLTLEGQ